MLVTSNQIVDQEHMNSPQLFMLVTNEKEEEV